MFSSTVFTHSAGRLVAFGIVLFAALAIGLSSHTGTAHAANGCGPDDWRGRFVPNAPFGFNFRSACNTHDRCYGTPWYRVAYSYAAAKRTCDSRFYGNMTAYCYRNFSGSNSVWSWCQWTAYGYYKAVANHGAGAYYNAQH